MIQFLIRSLENIEEAIKNGQSRETGNVGQIRRRKPQKKPTQNVLDINYTQTNTYNVNRTSALLQTTGRKE